MPTSHHGDLGTDVAVSCRRSSSGAHVCEIAVLGLPRHEFSSPPGADDVATAERAVVAYLTNPQMLRIRRSRPALDPMAAHIAKEVIGVAARTDWDLRLDVWLGILVDSSVLDSEQASWIEETCASYRRVILNKGG